MKCLDENTVLQYVEGLLTANAAEAMEEHVAECDECRWLLSMTGAAALQEVSSFAPTQFTALRDAEVEAMPPELRIAETLQDTYVVERFVGKGGMGTVYEASHRRLPRRFAIKFLTEACATDQKAVARLKREAEVTSRLHHPHIVEVTDFNQTADGAPFIVMELLEGEPLSRRLRRGALELAEVAAIVRQAASALAAAHRESVIHRDLKPTNIFLCRSDTGPFVKVMDFGISKVLGTQTREIGGRCGRPGWCGACGPVAGAGAAPTKAQDFGGQTR